MKKKMTPDEFHALPRREKAVLVAQDVLKMLARGKLTTKTGWGYIKYYGNYPPTPTKRKLQNHVGMGNLLAQHCTVCALGACFISTIRLGNRYNFAARAARELFLYDRSDISTLLRTIFPRATVNAIEQAFEGDFRGEDIFSLEDIMQNIIDNGGRFCPKKLRKPRGGSNGGDSAPQTGTSWGSV